MGPSPAGFTRDRLTWLGYLLYGFWSYVWGLFGPVMPFLRSELKLNYGVAALHFSALALGPLMAGVIGYRVIRAAGPGRVIWLGIALIVAGVIAVLLGTSPWCTIFGAWLIGFGGSHAGQSIIASLADRFGAQRAKAITELNISSSIFCALAPLTVVAGIRMGLPWKAALLVSIVALVAICWSTKLGGEHAWHIADLRTAPHSKLPRAYWLYFAIVFLSVAGEWSVTFWCPEFLEKVVHFSRANACAGLSVYLVSMLAGRIAGSRLTGLVTTHRLLSLATIAATGGFLLFWSGYGPWVTMLGLILLGLGEAIVYPLSLSAAIGVTDGPPTRATSTMSLSTGAAIFLAPLTLGVAADKIGLFNAYSLAAVLLTLAAATACWADLISGRRIRLEQSLEKLVLSEDPHPVRSATR